ncbi:uncharacterized protein LOC141825987 [Curcuma longa]|uniref:uncharacterized protein LOC141825987 n=1 Tax=Curcuma longa TaxID=136217 RepID=UPI003D9FA5E0
MASSAASGNSSRRTLDPIISDSFDLLRSNPKLTLCLFFLTLIPSPFSLFNSFIPINPIILQTSAFPFPLLHDSLTYYFSDLTALPRTAESLSATFLCFFLFFVPLTPILYILYYRMATGSASEPPLRTSAAKIFFTRLCVVVLDLAFRSLLLFLVWLQSRVVDLSSASGISFFVLFVFNLAAALIFGEFLRTLWVLSLVAAVAEGRCGVAAVRRAIELVARSCPERWRQIVGLPAFWYLTKKAVFAPFYCGGGAVVWAVVTVAGVAAVTLLNLATHVALYCELTERSAEETENKILMLL